MLSPEQLTMAKPGIPVEKPRRREIPEIPDPTVPERPERTIPAHPEPEPVRIPRESVPVGR